MQFGQPRRREFIALLGGAAIWPRPIRAQQSGKVSTIGILGISSAAFGQWLPALLQRLRELGWIENRTMAIEYRWTEGAQRALRAACRRARSAEGRCDRGAGFAGHRR